MILVPVKDIVDAAWSLDGAPTRYNDPSMSEIGIYRQRTSEQSELGLEYREYTCDMGVSLSLLSDS